jgi:tetratricopeptide (TPR) repeat protein
MTTDTTLPGLEQDATTLHRMAQAETENGRYEEAAKLLARVLELEPGHLPSRFDLAFALNRLERYGEVVDQLVPLLEFDPDDIRLQKLMGASLERIGRYEEAIEIHQEALRQNPDQPSTWVTLAELLSTVGRAEESIAAYRRVIALKPRFGAAWWGLANLKTGALKEGDVAAIRTALDSEYLTQMDAAKLNFALGKALEDAGEPEEAFRHYSEGNALRHQDLGYDPTEVESYVDRARILFTPAFFAARDGGGFPAPDPIFIVGMPRSGSTLVEQILASHPAIEGTSELPDLLSIARRLRLRGEQRGASSPELLAELSEEERTALGEEYISRTRIRRRTERPLFIDKTPNNWAHIGLIQLILPNAKIVDVRRHPLGCCLSNFKQCYGEGQDFTYSLTDLGRYYRDYVRLMSHFDEALPGRVHRVIYEKLVEDIEGEVHRLLDYVGVDFDPAVLRFHENERAVYTPSAEQVRRPINRSGMENWQPFEPWLGPLRKELGPVLTFYPEAP